MTSERTASTTLRLAICPADVGAGIPEYLGEALSAGTRRCLKLSCGSAIEVVEQDSISTLVARRISPAEIGAELKADLVLSATLYSLPGRFRLRMQMLRSLDGSLLWTDDFVVPDNKMRALATELTNRIALRAGVALSFAASNDDAEEQYSQEAYELVWRAHSEWKSLQRHQMQDALHRLRAAVELAPNWDEARSELVNLCAHQAIYGFMAPTVASHLIRRAAEYAVHKDSEELWAPLGWVYFHMDRDLHSAQIAFERCGHLPHDRWITRLRTTYALSRHHFGKAIAMLEACISLDPFAPELHALLAWAHHLDGNAAESLVRIEHALREFPQHELTNLLGSMILATNGQTHRALGIAEELLRKCPYLDPAMSAYAFALACAGRRAEAHSLLEQLEWLSRERFVLRAFTPAVYVVLGEYDAAMDELRAIDQSRCPWFFQTLADPRLKPLHVRLDFKELAAILPRMKAEAAPLAV